MVTKKEVTKKKEKKETISLSLRFYKKNYKNKEDDSYMGV